MLTIANIKDITYLERVAREDYLTAGGEPPGVWYNGENIGRVSRQTIQKGELPNVLSGKDADGNVLIPEKRGGKTHRPGLDLTFAAPKSVSVAWALADDDTRQAISAALQDSVFDTLDFLSREAGRARRGKGGKTLEEIKLIAGVYEHSTTRGVDGHVDPHLHAHANVANMGFRRQDGTWATLELACLVDYEKAGGAIFRAAFAKRLADMGFGIEQDERKDGWGFKLKGIPENIETAFAGRHEQIVKEAMAAGSISVEARNLAQKKTRAKKEENVKRSESLAEWQSRSKEMGFNYTPEMSKGPVREMDKIQKAHFESLVENEAVFKKTQLYQAVANYAVGVLDVSQIEETITRFKEEGAFFNLSRTFRGLQIFTTPSMRALEKNMVRMALEMQEDTSHTLPAREKDMKILVGGNELTKDQYRTFDYVTSTPGALKVVVGWAGTGKSFTMRAVKEAYERQGFSVIGAAFAGKAAEELEKGSGIQTTTIDSRLLSHAAKKLNVDKKTVLVVDEAGMAGTKHIEALTRIVNEAGGKVIFVGDQKQVKPIAAGGAFELLMEKVGYVELSNVFRQKKEWLNRAVKAIGANEYSYTDVHGNETYYSGGVAEGLRAFDKNGMLHRVEKREDLHEKIVSLWHENLTKEPEKSRLMLAFNRADVKKLNELARGRVRDTLSKEETKIEIQIPSSSSQRRDILYLVKGLFGARPMEKEERSFAVGESIIFLKNDYRVGVKNGQLGTITKIEGTVITATVNDKTVQFDTGMYNFFDYGYAVTVHKSQGTTLDNAYLLLSEALDRNTAYVGTSRAKEATHVVYDKQTALAMLKAAKESEKKKLQALKTPEEALFHKVEQSKPKVTTNTFRKIDITPKTQKAITS